MASRYVPRSDKPRSGGLLRFTTVADLQEIAMRKARSVAPIDGLSLSVTLEPSDLARVAVDRTFGAEMRRVGSKIADKAVDQARKISKKTYDTGLFMSSWRATVTTDLVGVRVELSNSAPYASYVHRSGERSNTVLNGYIRPMVRKLRGELAADMKAAIRRLARPDPAARRRVRR